jgi:hypothetical protein
VSQNKDGGALHLYRSESSIRLPDAGKWVAEGLLENITRHTRSKCETILKELKIFRHFVKGKDSLSMVH